MIHPAAGRTGRFGLAYALLLLAPCLWGGNFVVGRAMGGEVPAVWLNLLRWIVAALVFAPFVAPRVWARRRAIMRELPSLVVLAGLGLVGFNTFLYNGLKEASVAAAALAFAATPFLVIVLDAGVRRRPPRMGSVLYAGMCVAGMAVFLADDLAAPSLSTTSMVMLGAATLSFAGYSVALRHLARGLSSSESFFAQILLCIPVQLWITLQTEPDFRPIQMSADAWAAVTYVGVFAAAIAFAAWSEGVRRVEAEQAGAFLAFVPVFAGVLGWLFLEDVTTPGELLALLAVCVAAVAIERQARHPADGARLSR